jgi:hypothetical protein
VLYTVNILANNYGNKVLISNENKNFKFMQFFVGCAAAYPAHPVRTPLHDSVQTFSFKSLSIHCIIVVLNIII